MTTVVYPSLDGLLAAATPVEAAPFDMDSLFPHLHWCLAVAQEVPLLDEQEVCDCFAADTRERIARYVNTLRVDTENARRWVDRLQGECAAKDARIAEALRWLDMAASFAVTEDCEAAIDDAAAALRGGAE